MTKVKAGDHVGVGCMVDSCRQCLMCHRGEEQFCHKRKLCFMGNYSTAIWNLSSLSLVDTQFLMCHVSIRMEEEKEMLWMSLLRSPTHRLRWYIQRSPGTLRRHED